MASAAGTVQLNVRMDRELKEAGDLTLSLAGISPSALVRQVWAKIAQGGDSLAQLTQVLSDCDGNTRQAAVRAKLDALESAAHLAESLDLPGAPHTPVTDDELEEALYDEYLESFGA